MHTADIRTDEELAVFVATRQARMASMDPFAVARAERLLLERPGREHYQKRHKTHSAEDEADDLLRRHRERIIADAHAGLLAVDPVGLHARPIHVVDFDEIGVRSEAVGGFTLSDGGWADLRPILPAGAKPGPVVALNLRAEIADAVRDCPPGATEAEIVESAARIINWTALHEYGHVVDCDAADQIVCPDIDIPGPPDLAHIVRALAQPRSIADSTAAHGAQWVRALYHAQRRHGWKRYDISIDQWWNDVARYVPDPGPLATALLNEWHQNPRTEPLVDVLRRPAPAAYLDLFPSRAQEMLP